MNVRTIKVLHVQPHNDLSGQWNENRLYSNLFNILLCTYFFFFQHFFLFSSKQTVYVKIGADHFVSAYF